MTEKQEAYEKRWELFKLVWSIRPHKSQISGRWLGKTIKSYFFDHLLERSVYPEVEYEEGNILLVTPDEHARKGRGFPGEEQKGDKLYKELILKAKQRYEEQTLYSTSEERSKEDS